MRLYLTRKKDIHAETQGVEYGETKLVHTHLHVTILRCNYSYQHSHIHTLRCGENNDICGDIIIYRELFTYFTKLSVLGDVTKV